MSKNYSPIDITETHNNYYINYNQHISKYYKYINSIYPNHMTTIKKRKKKKRVAVIEPPPDKQFSCNSVGHLKISVNLIPSGDFNWNNDILYNCV